jgi:hypothetical protein
MHRSFYVTALLAFISLGVGTAALAEESYPPKADMESSGKTIEDEQGQTGFRYDDYEATPSVEDEGKSEAAIVKPQPLLDDNGQEFPFALPQDDEIASLKERYDNMSGQEQKTAVKGPLGGVLKQVIRQQEREEQREEHIE